MLDTRLFTAALAGLCLSHTPPALDRITPAEVSVLFLWLIFNQPKLITAQIKPKKNIQSEAPTTSVDNGETKTTTAKFPYFSAEN